MYGTERSLALSGLAADTGIGRPRGMPPPVSLAAAPLPALPVGSPIAIDTDSVLAAAAATDFDMAGDSLMGGCPQPLSCGGSGLDSGFNGSCGYGAGSADGAYSAAATTSSVLALAGGIRQCFKRNYGRNCGYKRC